METSTPTAPEAGTEPRAGRPKATNAYYWNRRKDSVYYYVAELVCRRFGTDAKSVLDVGSNGTPTLEWHRQTAQRLVSVDHGKPYRAPGVESRAENFFAYEPGTPFDLVTCFQVLEHVPDAAAFAQKLLRVGKVLVVSVPYRWRAGATKSHIHDPVDEAKMRAWFGREPVYSYIVSELNGVARLIQVYGPSELAGPVRLVPAPARPTANGGTRSPKPKSPPTLTMRVKRLAKRVLRKLHLLPPAPVPPAPVPAKPIPAPAGPAVVAPRVVAPSGPPLAERPVPAKPIPAPAAPVPRVAVPSGPPLAERLADPALLYPLGYLVGRGSGRVPAHYRDVPFPLPLAVHPRTKLGVAQDASGAVAVVGEALDPQAPERNHAAVAQAVLAAGADRQAVIDRLIGRFVVITAPAVGEPEIQTDAIGLRCAYFSRVAGGVIAGSHARMVSEAAFAAPAPMADLPMKWGYPGIDTPYDDVLRLPPNVALPLRGGRPRRFFPVAEIPPTTIEDAWAFAFDQASRAIDALARRSPLLVSLTSGLDSRCTLAASRAMWSKLRFFTYVDVLGSTRADHEIDSAVAEDMAAILGLSHETFPYRNLDRDPLVREVLDANAFGNHGKRLVVEYLRRFGGQPLVHVRTNLLELGRANLFAKSRQAGQLANGPSDAQHMASYYTSRGKFDRREHILPAFDRYVSMCDFQTALRFASPWDLYFVEHRMGAWQSNVCAESDVVFDTVIAFNSREIVRRIMGVPQEVRSTSAHLRERLAQMLPEVADIPINPDQYERRHGAP